MKPSKVYFTDLHTRIGLSQLDKLENLIRAAGIENIDFERKMTAIKIHFGEPGNLTFLRPNYARRVADVIKSLGEIPFLLIAIPASTWKGVWVAVDALLLLPLIPSITQTAMPWKY